MFYVYILQDDSGKIYIGYSNNLRRRLIEHQKQRVYTTKRMLGPQLIYYEAYPTRESAREREKKLKQHGSSFQGLMKRLHFK